MLALLLGCGLRRSELAGLEIGDLQQREEQWAIVDLVGKGGHVRTVPVPDWAKATVDDWATAARITDKRLFRSIRKNGTLWGDGLTQNVVWYVVREAAKRAAIDRLAPHDLRRYAESRIMPNRWLDLRFGGQFRSSRPRAIRHYQGGATGSSRRPVIRRPADTGSL